MSSTPPGGELEEDEIGGVGHGHLHARRHCQHFGAGDHVALPALACDDDVHIGVVIEQHVHHAGQRVTRVAAMALDVGAGVFEGTPQRGVEHGEVARQQIDVDREARIAAGRQGMPADERVADAGGVEHPPHRLNPHGPPRRPRGDVPVGSPP